MSERKSPLDELDDSLIPPPLEAPPDFKIDLDPATLEEFIKSAKRQRQKVSRLLGRNLEKEVKLLYDCLTMPTDKAAIRVGSKREAQGLRNKLYYAKKQEEYRVNLIEDREEGEWQRERQRQLETLAFGVDEDERGHFVLIYKKADYTLELLSG
jgi:hypothetical protein